MTQDLRHHDDSQDQEGEHEAHNVVPSRRPIKYLRREPMVPRKYEGSRVGRHDFEEGRVEEGVEEGEAVGGGRGGGGEGVREGC